MGNLRDSAWDRSGRRGQQPLKAVLMATIVVLSLAHARIASAHPVPFSYVDVRVGARDVQVTVVAHIFDVGHDLQVDRADRLLDPTDLRTQNAAFTSLVRDRLQLEADGQRLNSNSAEWADAEPLPDRQSVRLHVRHPLDRTPGVVTVTARMFPYDPVHQTFVNFYDNENLASQAILDQAP